MRTKQKKRKTNIKRTKKHKTKKKTYHKKSTFEIYQQLILFYKK
tara:strand:- start:168 stop:299 length:132 start_codon:yes stop_codon:yes gene_type:complete